jgi:hypothetical protein
MYSPGDGQGVDHAFELLPDIWGKGRRGAAQAAYFAAAVEVMGLKRFWVRTNVHLLPVLLLLSGNRDFLVILGGTVAL